MTPAEHRKQWIKLQSIATNEDVVEFWSQYADYLVACGIVSGYRQTLYDMARMTVERLEVVE